MAVASEDGVLQRVAIVSPRWYKQTEPINEKQAFEYKFSKIDIAGLLHEHAALLGALRASGADVVEITPNAVQPYALNVRDSAVVVGDKLIAASMRKAVRQTEPFWLVPQLGRAVDAAFIDTGHLEGGDVFVLGAACLVGLSERTDLAGLESFKSKIDGTVFAVPLKTGVLHLDVALNVLGDTVVVAPDLLDDFKGLLGTCESLGINHVVEVSANDAWDLETNFFFVGPDRAIAAESSSIGRKLLDERGINVTTVPMTQHHRIGGSVRCATLPLERAV